MSWYRKILVMALLSVVALGGAPSACAADLRYGAQGSSVTELQTNLGALGYLMANPTGYFGQQTHDAVVSFQKAAGIAADGIVGPATAAHVASRVADKTPLKQGSSGERVTHLQEQLVAAGCFEGPVTGYFGALTRDAVVRFQNSAGLLADGVAGSATVSALSGASPSSVPVTALTVGVEGVLKEGSRGASVTLLQQQLASKGYFDAALTEYFGPVTRDAVVRFQRSAGLLADGIAGQATLEALSAQPATASSSASQSGALKTLKQGSSGEAVAALQTKLASQGHFAGTVTGVFCSATHDAVVRFQRAAGLMTDGIAGPLTLTALDAGIQSEPSPASAVEVNYTVCGTYEVVGYYCQYHDGDFLSHESLLKTPEGTLDAIAVFMYSVTAQGDIVGSDPRRSVETAKEMNIKPLALVNNAPEGPFSKDVVHNVLAQTKARDNAIESMHKVVKDNGFAGVNLNFEAVPPEDRDLYTEFVRLLSEKLGSDDLMVTLSVPAKIKEDPTNSWSAAFDYRALGETADRIMIMTYDQHWSSAPPGPISGSTGWKVW